MLDREFDAFTDARPQLYPEDRRAEVEAMIAANYQPVNNGVYRAGFAGTQEAYEEAIVATSTEAARTMAVRSV